MHYFRFGGFVTSIHPYLLLYLASRCPSIVRVSSSMLTLKTRIWNALKSCSITYAVQMYLCAAHTKLPARWYNEDNNGTARDACRKVAPAPHAALGSRAEKITKVHSRCVGRQGLQQVFVDLADSEDATQTKQCQMVPGRDTAVQRPRFCID